MGSREYKGYNDYVVASDVGTSDDDTGFATEDSDEKDLTLVNLKKPRGCTPWCTAERVCHCVYVVLFILYMIIFPLWAKWLVVEPMPAEYWHSDFKLFPPVTNYSGEAALLDHSEKSIEMTSIPMSPSSCDSQCADNLGYRGSEMNFRVGLTLNNPALAKVKAHTVYPVLLASADFHDWWVVADRRHASPNPFWAAHTEESGRAFYHVTPACTKPPETALESDGVTGSYTLACVTWKPAALKKLAAATVVTDGDLGQYCDAVGGACGWSCGSSIEPNRLPGCTADGQLQVTPTSIAGREIAGANFEGDVKMTQCLRSDQPGVCETNMAMFSKWKCHKCQYDPSAGEESDIRRLLPTGPGGISRLGVGAVAAGSISGPTIYNSLPKFRVDVSGLDVPEGYELLSSPEVFIFASSEGETWKKLFKEDDPKIPPPAPLDSSGKPVVVQSSEEAEDGGLAVEHSYSKHAMKSFEKNRIEIEPDWCFGKKGPLYLVACAVNSSIYSGSFKEFAPGQKVAPPPFNDRCLAIGGRCAVACSPEQSAMANCSADGHIPQVMLAGNLKAQRNTSTAVWLFCYVLLLGFTVKVAVLCPGIFSTYSHFGRYDPSLTRSLRYIAVCIPSHAENKCVSIRSLIGAISSMPSDSGCRFHVTYVDEGHRAAHKAMWDSLVQVLANIPRAGATYEERVMQFFQHWVEETKRMDIVKLRDGSLAKLDDEVLERVSGNTTLKKLKKEAGWGYMSQAELAPLETALRHLQEVLTEKEDGHANLHLDDVADWSPEKGASTLRMHYVARAKPAEDERTIKSQHIGAGTFYYKVPTGASPQEWLALRAKAAQLLYGMDDEDPDSQRVPLQTSRGKAGALNFAENYLSSVASRAEHAYGDERDQSPCLFSICNPYHQYQPDFFHTTLPHFFDEDGELDPDISLTQCPVYFHELQDKLDYLDSNNAQFFRLHGLIQNSCGGVGGWNTNATRMIPYEDDRAMWVPERTRVRNKETGRKALQYVEHRFFNESCQVEHLASSMEQVLQGRRSQFINRRLSYGMTKSANSYLSAMQKTMEGNVVLFIQSFLQCHKGFCMLWCTAILYMSFIASLLLLVHSTDHLGVVRIGLLSADDVETLLKPVVNAIRRFATSIGSSYFERQPGLLEDYVEMGAEFVTWLACLVVVLLFVYVATEVLSLFHRCCGSCARWPDEMRWWGRLLIRVHGVSHFLWFWMPAFWIGVNYWNVVARQSYHFSPVGMFVFIAILQLLNWGMITASSNRAAHAASAEANEVVSLSLDNVWRQTQSFYITFPLQVYSMLQGVRDYFRWSMYGEDISFAHGDARGSTSKTLVKYWTLLLIIGAIAAWVYHATHVGQHGDNRQAALSSCIIVTIIALDVLHPCAYLWVGEDKLGRDAAAKMSWSQALASPSWWKRCVYLLVLNETMSNLIKWLGPLCFVALPFLIFVMPYIGVNMAFMMLTGTTAF